MYRDRNSVFGAFPSENMRFLKSGFRIRVPYRNAIAKRNSRRVPGWLGLELGAQEMGPPIIHQRVRGGCFAGVFH